ncbi:sohB protein, peptidase U7 family protein [Nitzschia inconspicua]|uniref:SohB protein, peptidase U7 family protein n=1 Tax=Nitzschia inconspicua TaxID=303405 RepID=A0A9K3LTT3_9STRA|nr:sohB protein, peptidase U7 family protein [Nitzschia inconspicua]
MKWIRLVVVSSIFASVVLLLSVPMVEAASKTRNHSVIMASVTTKSTARNKDTGTSDSSDDDQKTNKKKAFWSSFGGSKQKKDNEDATEQEKSDADDDQKAVKSSGPFGIFRRSKDTKKKDDSEGGKDSSKATEKEQKMKPTTDSQIEKSKTVDEDKKEEDSQSDTSNEEKTAEEDRKDENKSEDSKDEKEKKDELDSSQSSPQGQSMLSPTQYTVMYRPMPITSPQRMPPGASPGAPTPNQQTQLLLAGTFANLVALTSRLALLNWLVSKLQSARELKEPEQHFMWECINDKYYQDDLVWKSVQNRPPLSSGLSKMKWKKIVKKTGPSKEEKRKKDAASTVGPSRTVIVIELSFAGNPDPTFSDFANMVAFLVSANTRYKKFFGSEPEVILNIQSTGGEATSFALAAAQVNRLTMAGYKVTACVDRFAASGGYMIASQASQIIAAPFAIVGSIGVIMEALNFHEALKSYGVKALTLKAGEMKVPITQFGEVTDKDVKLKLEDLEYTHRDFIELCRSKRPELDPSVCNGRILSGDKALECGLIDRILTSEEYIFEKIADGDLVMKLHLISPDSEHTRFLRVLQILPHIRQKIQSALMSLSGGRVAKFNGLPNAQVQLDMNFVNNLVQGVAFASMIHRAFQRSEFWRR